MEHSLGSIPPICMGVSPTNGHVCIGFVDGSLQLLKVQQTSLKKYWMEKLKTSVRGVSFSHDGRTIYCLTAKGSLCTYDVTSGKKERFLYVGADDGYIEVFKQGEYGNLLERVETGHSRVDSILQLRHGLLMTASGLDPNLNLMHAEPFTRLGRYAKHGKTSVDAMAIAGDREFVVSVSGDEGTLKVLPLRDILDKAPVLRAVDVPKHMTPRRNTFFDGLCSLDTGEDRVPETFSKHNDEEDEDEEENSSDAGETDEEEEEIEEDKEDEEDIDEEEEEKEKGEENEKEEETTGPPLMKKKRK